MRLPGTAVRQNSVLHAKVYWTPEKAVFGSSNASSNGLRFEGAAGAGWREANVLVTDRETLQQIGDWFEAIWRERQTRSILDADLEAARAIRNGEPAGAMLAGNGTSLLDALIEDPASFQRRKAVVRLYEYGDVSDEAEAECGKLRQALGDETIKYYEDWLPDISGHNVHGTTIIDPHKKNGRWQHDGIWQVIDDADLCVKTFRRGRRQKGTVIFVKPKDNAFGYVAI